MTAPWIATSSGVAFDLLDPRPEKIRFAVDVAPALARLPRFNGHVPSGPYSVAQHCVVGADALLAETGRKDLAAHFLLHDAHEAFIGDMTRPVASAIAELVGTAGQFREAMVRLKDQIDRAIYVAAGMRFPEPVDLLIVANMDSRMLDTERRQLLPQCERHWDAGPGIRAVRLKGKLTPWPWHQAADEWLKRFRTYCPGGAL